MLTESEKQGYKQQIVGYLQGINYPMKQTDALRCLCPTHDDNDPTAIVYGPEGKKGPGVWCPACDKFWDVFEFAKEINGFNNFPDCVKEIQRVLGGEMPEYKPVQKPEEKPINLVPLSYDKAKSVFTEEKFLSSSEFMGRNQAKKNGKTAISKEEALILGYGNKVVKVWPYKNESGMIDMVDVRFEGNPRKKGVISFYWNGKNVKFSKAPVLVYNKDLIKKYPDHVLIINEGAKKADASKDFIELGGLPLAWSGGASKIKFADWTCLYGRDVIIYPDDDRHKDKRTDTVKPDCDQPGLKAALWLKENIGPKCKTFKIATPYLPARKLKKSGADIVEVLQLLSTKEAYDYVISCEEHEYKTYEIGSERKDPPPNGNDPPINSTGDFSAAPFRILGTAEDGRTYFLDRHRRLYDLKLESISRNKLQMLAPITYWMDIIGTNKMSNDDWLNCCDDIIEIAGDKDFTLENNIRGRGAWREPDGRICYYDGKNKYGEWDDSKIYLRKQIKDIGIGSGYLSFEEIEKIKEAVFQLSFETKADAMKLLGWSVLAPFSGALKFRPQIMITGPSNSGKSMIEQFVVRKIAAPHIMSGGETTAAGYIFSRMKDSGGVDIEEFEQNTEKEKYNREAILSIVRQSTSDDTPPSYKGTSDQNAVSYVTRDMFCVVSISAEVENIANDNRITRVNTKKIEVGKGKLWGSIEKDLNENITPLRCAKLRNMSWEKLKNIMSLSNMISIEIQNHTGLDHRFAISEGTLMAAYFVIWKLKPNPSKEEIIDFVKGTYSMIEIEDRRNEAEEIIETILQEKVRVFGEKQKEYTVADVCAILISGQIESGTDMGGMRDLSRQETIDFRMSIENNGIYVQDNLLGIANNHKEVKRILRRPYRKTIKRHPKCVDTSKNINRNGGGGQKCSMFAVFEDVVPF